MGDSLYPSVYHRAFAPPWVDALLLREGIMPPRGAAFEHERTFTLIDLGCGDGLGLMLNAAACPESRFIGIDAMGGHIERARSMASELGLSNVEFRCATFSEALRDEPAGADYVSVQGVLSWISPSNRHDLLVLVARNLKAGGAAAMGYNCLPGWSPFLSFQRLVWTLSRAKPGSPSERFARALDDARELSGAGMTAFGKAQLEQIDDLRERLPQEYFPHEYLNAHWQPLWSADVIDDAASHGLRFARSGMAQRLREDFILKAAQREALTKIEASAARELAADMFLNCSFRIDLYVKAPARRLGDEKARSARLAGCWMATALQDEIAYSASTPAGTIRFDNAAARAIMNRLDQGPATFGDIAAAHPGMTPADVLNAGDALFVAGRIAPAGRRDDEIAVGEVNRWIVDTDGGGAKINALLTPHGPVAAPQADLHAILNDSAARRRLGLGTK